MLDPRAFLINSKTGRVVAATFVEFLSGNSTNPSICFTDSPDSGLQCDNAGAVNYVKNGINLGELGTASNLIGGSDTQIQFNDSGSFGGSADLTWDDTGKELGVGGDINLDDGGTYATTLQMVTATANRTISFPDATGTVALVAGSNGQVTYNNAGAQAGLTSASIGSTGEINISLAGAASTPPVSFTGSWFTGGTATTTKPQLLIEPTGTTSTAWSTSGTGLGVNAASGFSGRLLDLQTNGTSQMVVQGDGKLGIGTTSPGGLLHLNRDDSNDAKFIIENDDGQFSIIANNNTAEYLSSEHIFLSASGATEKARLDSSGRLLVGTSSARDKFFNASSQQTLFQVERVGVSGSQSYQTASFITNSADGVGAYVTLGASRGTTVNSYTALQSGDVIGKVAFQGADGAELVSAAEITALVDGTPGANDMPGRLVFSTTADGASSPTERMRIRSGGATGIFCDANSDVLYLSATAAAGTSRYLLIGKHSATGPIASGTESLLVFTNGNIQNTNNSYAGISDIKLKENIIDANSQWDDIKALQVRNYNFKEGQTHTQIGLIAQEVELVSPGLVGESIDDETGESTKSVNYSVLYMKAVKALQEAMERIETLEQRLNDAGIA